MRFEMICIGISVKGNPPADRRAHLSSSGCTERSGSCVSCRNSFFVPLTEQQFDSPPLLAGAILRKPGRTGLF